MLHVILLLKVVLILQAWNLKHSTGYFRRILLITTCKLCWSIGKEVAFSSQFIVSRLRKLFQDRTAASSCCQGLSQRPVQRLHWSLHRTWATEVLFACGFMK